MTKRVIPIVHHTFTDKLATREGLAVDGLEIYKRGESPKLYRSNYTFPYRIRIDRPFVLSIRYTEKDIRGYTYDRELTKIYADEKIRVFKDGREFILKW